MKYLLSLLFLFSVTSQARQIKIVVIDSGMPSFKTDAKICPNGLYDLTHTDMKDRLQHGTNILGIIADGLNDAKVDYCIYDIKIYDDFSMETPFIVHLMSYIYVYYLNADIVNYSSSGPTDDEAEKVLIKGLIDHGVKFVAAAGNDSKDLDKVCTAWPACIPGVISVGNLVSTNHRHKTSNYGKIVKAWHRGTEVCSNHVCETGTSQAAALETVVQATKLYKESLKGSNK